MTLAPGPEPAPARQPGGTLAPGSSLGPRYQIVRLLGKGGMGAVYQAHDRELLREVALKLVAPHLAAEPWVLERFKREIQLSSIVTHANVLRIYDLGEVEGLKFLTMQYIEGETLADLMAREGALPPERATRLFRQVCAGLDAAHEKGVLHRDLKPQNVMVDGEGRSYLTDFGLATSGALATMTQTGALLGTPHYMSPEQVRGEHVDARSDIFSLGVIFHQMLTGALPFAGESPFEVMMARTRAAPRPLGELRPDAPSSLQRIVDRCLAIEPANRPGSVKEILAELDGSVVLAPVRRPRGPRGKAARRIAAAGLAVLVAAASGLGIATWLRGRRPALPPRAQTVLIADIDNRTGEAVFDGTLEPVLALALEGATFITSYSRVSALRVADQLKLEGRGLDERRARLVAQREGVAIVASGAIDRAEGGYRLSARAIDAFTGQPVVETAEAVEGKGDALPATTKLAARIRRALGDATPEGVQIKEGETFGAASLEAAHEYALGARMALDGQWNEARKHYLEAIRLDPGMGRAYSGVAVLEYNRGRHAEAEKYYAEAMKHLDRMSDREKHRTRGAYYLVVNRDPDKAVETFAALVAQYPADNAGLANLALAHAFRGDFAKALSVGRRAVEIYPKNVAQLNNVGFYATFAGEFGDAIRQQRRVVELNPAFVQGHAGLALALLADGQRDAAASTWAGLRARGGRGESLAAEGLADLAVYEGRLEEARSILEAGIRRDLAERDQDAAARKRASLATLLVEAGHTSQAVAAAEQALGESGEDPIRFIAASVLAEAGQERRATALADALEKGLGPAPRTYAALVRGEVARRKGQRAVAIEHFRAAVRTLDSWLARFALGRAYLEADAFAQAQDELERCDRRKGEAIDVFLESIPTFHLYPPVRYYLGRAYEGLHSPGAGDAYRAFLAMERGGESRLAADARRRLAAP